MPCVACLSSFSEKLCGYTVFDMTTQSHTDSGPSSLSLSLGTYNISFRPIQQYHPGDFSPSDSSNATSPCNTFPTVTPTPLRSSRPPLLATPPGFPYIQQG